MTPDEKARLRLIQELEERRRRPKGLGDVVARVTAGVGIKTCGPCQQRREALNKLFPLYPVKKTR